MRYAQIGSLTVSVVGLGCNNLGRSLDQKAGERVVGSALEAGMTFFDTAENYGNGDSERLLGAALGGHRDEVVIATKFGLGVPEVDGSGGARPEYVRAAAERSLAKLGTDHIDLYQLHRPDPDTPISATIGAMADLVAAGKVREIGCSNMDADQLSEAIEASRSAGHPVFASNQVEYSMVDRSPEANGLEAVCASESVALLPYYPLASGLLTGKVTRTGVPTGRLAMDRYQHYLTDSNFDLVERLVDFSRSRGVSVAHLALGWLLRRPTVPAVTPGATSTEQIHINAAASSWIPTDEEANALDDILRGDHEDGLTS